MRHVSLTQYYCSNFIINAILFGRKNVCPVSIFILNALRLCDCCTVRVWDIKFSNHLTITQMRVIHVLKKNCSSALNSIDDISIYV